MVDDQELMYLYHLGSMEAYEMLLKRYKKVIEVYSVYHYLSYMELSNEDLVQMAWIHFYSMLDHYREDMNVKVITYFTRIINREFQHANRTMRQRKRIPYYKLVAFQEDIKLNDHQYLYDRMQPDHLLFLKDEIEQYQYILEDDSSNFEKEILEYLLMGYQAKEIAEMFHIDIKKVYNGQYRVRKKIREKMSSMK